jgi:hypothetical protein
MSSITRPAALVRQGSLKLYASSATVRDLKRPGFYQINKLEPEGQGPGFQRLLNQGRAKKLTDYLLDGHTEVTPSCRPRCSWRRARISNLMRRRIPSLST